MSSTATPFPARVELTGEGLVLRDWTEADLAAMPGLFDHPDIAHWTPIVSPFDAAAARARLVRDRELRAEGTAMLLAVTVDGGAPLGEVMLRCAPEGTEIGYAIGPAHRGQGLAARAVRVMAAYAFEQLRVEQVILELEAENTASAAVAAKAGFTLLDVPLIEGEEKGRPYVLQTWGLQSPGSGREPQDPDRRGATPPPLLGINHLTLPTTDLDRLLSYYTQVLGAGFAFERAATATGPRIAALDVGGNDHLMLVGMTAAPRTDLDPLGQAGWGLRVGSLAELEEMRERILAAGHRVDPIVTLPAQWTMTAHDPDGRPVDIRAHRPRTGS
ncbi:GNAT family N-acetyltransferase [Streptomyces triticagri]|uniref:GNAT family N-acetyltransferase n=1 Tax=Streptomyces triticagri TaxID=2293568 RepID=UPI001F41D885|nr:GNAT family N-acetyltransferase [Streptomyces triticagri]